MRNQLNTAKGDERARIEKEIAAKIAGVNELLTLGADYEAKLHTLAQPVTRTYELRLTQPIAAKK
jgi:hypothetical protein